MLFRSGLDVFAGDGTADRSFMDTHSLGHLRHGHRPELGSAVIHELSLSYENLVGDVDDGRLPLVDALDQEFPYNNYTNDLIKEKYNMRWVGALVADFHRTLIKSGVILYPENSKSKNGKIRLVYEAYPLAYIIEKCGGMSSNGRKSILEDEFPWEDIHKRTPIFFGSEYEIFKLYDFL